MYNACVATEQHSDCPSEDDRHTECVNSGRSASNCMETRRDHESAAEDKACNRGCRVGHPEQRQTKCEQSTLSHGTPNSNGLLFPTEQREYVPECAERNDQH